MKMPKLLVFDSHPVQYRVPIWQAMELLHPGCVHVAYASDCSVRGFNDRGFDRTLSWDEPMLSGYPYTILHSENGTPLSGWNSLSGRGIKNIIEQQKPDAILLTGLNYRYDLVAYQQALQLGIPLWLRCETQDKATHRTKYKAAVRSVLYHIVYQPLKRCFYIGELNKDHYLQHGISSEKLRPARYGTINRFTTLTTSEKEEVRLMARNKAGIPPAAFVIGFSGKFIPKKDPEILFHMLGYLPESLRKKTHLYFMGSGPLEDELKILAATALKQWGILSYFAGFVNQSQLAPHYLAMDVMILPSRKMGETWGLVANEALQAGCGVVVSNAVGCSADFAHWERFRIFNEGNARALANCVAELAAYTRDFSWALPTLTSYSIEATAEALLLELNDLAPSQKPVLQ